MFDKSPFKTALPAKDFDVFAAAVAKRGTGTPALVAAIDSARTLFSETPGEADALAARAAQQQDALFADLIGETDPEYDPELQLASLLVNTLGLEKPWAVEVLADRARHTSGLPDLSFC